jgi:hypothetical protein
MASFGKLLPLDLNGDLTPKAAQDLSFIVDAAVRMQRLIQRHRLPWRLRQRQRQTMQPQRV